MPHSPSTHDAFDRFSAILQAQGLRESMAYLLSLTDYRFIGLWRFCDGRADAALHYDREDPSQLYAQEIADSATYCCYVRDSKGVFMTANALLDPATVGHPAREQVPAYCGVPVLDEFGDILATLCHYDVVPRDPEQINIELIIQVSSALARGGLVPPYPSAPGA